MDFKVIFIHPLHNGLKAIIKVNNKNYIITFQSEKSSAEFRVFSEDKSDKLINDKDTREEILNQFIRFLKQNREEIKVGVFFDDSNEMYNQIFKLKNLEHMNNGLLNITFSIVDKMYHINNVRVIKNKGNLIFDDSRASYVHEDNECFCENIKEKHNIKNFNHCLILLEHQNIIFKWIELELKKKLFPEKQNKIIQFDNFKKRL